MHAMDSGQMIEIIDSSMLFKRCKSMVSRVPIRKAETQRLATERASRP